MLVSQSSIFTFNSEYDMHRTQFVVTAVLMLSMMMSRSSHADTVTCRFDVNDVRLSLEVHPQQDIYAFQKIDLPGDFRFAGQWLPALDKFKAYVYHTPNSRYVLLTMQEFELSKRACRQDFGRHRVYDGANERELYFHCRMTCQDATR